MTKTSLAQAIISRRTADGRSASRRNPDNPHINVKIGAPLRNRLNRFVDENGLLLAETVVYILDTFLEQEDY